MFEPAINAIEKSAPSFDDALYNMMTGWLSHTGPTTAQKLSEALHLPADAISQALLRLEITGTVLRGTFEGTDLATPAEQRLMVADAPSPTCAIRM